MDVDLDGQIGGSPEQDLSRLGLDVPGFGLNPDPEAIVRWRASYPALVGSARAEAERRGELRRLELVELATRFREEELEALAVWRYEERERVETFALGDASQLTFEAAESYQTRMSALEDEYEARKEAIRDRSEIRLAGLELIGGRLLVSEAS